MAKCLSGTHLWKLTNNHFNKYFYILFFSYPHKIWERLKLLFVYAFFVEKLDFLRTFRVVAANNTLGIVLLQKYALTEYLKLKLLWNCKVFLFEQIKTETIIRLRKLNSSG